MTPSEFEAKLEQIVRSASLDSKDGVLFCICDLEELIEEFGDGR